MGDVEFGFCQCCGNDGILQRTYFNYNIKCECHSPYHFEIVRHCKHCIPKEPETTKISFKTKDLDKLFRQQKINNILNRITKNK